MIQTAWDIIQNQILGMRWLYELVEALLASLHLDAGSKWVQALHFFLYDVIKITILLCILIFLVSYVQSYFPPERSRRILGRFNGISARIMAALLGTVTPFCSCSSIPLFIGFTSARIPLAVTFSFLISSPMVDLGSLVILMSIFGAKVAIVYVVTGLIIAVAGGTVIGRMHMEGQVEEFIMKAQGKDIEVPQLTRRDRVSFAFDQMSSTLQKVFPYILVGVAIGAVIHNWIPQSLIVTLLGDSNPLSVPLAAVVGTPMYGDIFGAIPIAEALLTKGAMLGTVLAFMMSVTTLSLPSMILLRKAIKPPLLFLFITVCITGIILVGYLFNSLQFLFL